MIIELRAIGNKPPLTAERRGEVLILNGEEFDFSPLLEDASLPVRAIASEYFADFTEVIREEGELHFVLFVPWGNNAPDSTKNSSGTVLYVTQDGVIDLPIYDLPPEEPEALPELLQDSEQEVVQDE